MGIMMAANLGGSLLPLSSPQALIAVSALKEFHVEIQFTSWMLVAFPVTFVSLLGVWVIILFFIQLSKIPQEQEAATQNHLFNVAPLTHSQVGMVMLCVALIVAFVFSDVMDHYLGGVVIVGFLFLFIAYGSGFCSTDDFNNLNWDVVINIAGANALNYAMKQSGLAKFLAGALLTQRDIVGDYIWLNSVKITGFCVVISCFFGQSCTSIIFLPLILPLAIQLYAPEVVAIMCVLGITFGMCFPFSSQDNYIISSATRDDFRRRYLSMMDVIKVGLPGTILSFVVIITLGYWIGITHWGLPPHHILKDSPDSLRPSVAVYDEGDALSSRLQAIENRFERLEDRSQISVNTKGSSSFLSVSQIAFEQFGHAALAHTSDAKVQKNLERAEVTGSKLVPGHVNIQAKKAQIKPKLEPEASR